VNNVCCGGEALEEMDPITFGATSMHANEITNLTVRLHCNLNFAKSKCICEPTFSRPI